MTMHSKARELAHQQRSLEAPSERTSAIVPTQGRAAPAPPSLLVVVPTLNEAANVSRLLDSIEPDVSSFPNSLIAIVDGGSRDGTCDVAKERAAKNSAIKLLRNPQQVQSAALNLAVAALGSDSDVVIRCDAHCVYPPGFCSSLVDTLRSTGAHSVVVAMDSVGVGTWQRAIAALSNSLIGTGGSAHRAGSRSGFVDHGHHAAFMRDPFCAVGGYDETFTHNEDAELDCRQRAHGHRIFLDCNIRVGYFPRCSLAALWRQYFSYGAGRARTVRRHPRSLRLRQLAVPVHMLGMLMATLAALLFPPLLLWPLSYVWFLAAWSIFSALRHRDLAHVLIAPAAITMHFAWASGFLWSLSTSREHRWTLGASQPPARFRNIRAA